MLKHHGNQTPKRKQEGPERPLRTWKSTVMKRALTISHICALDQCTSASNKSGTPEIIQYSMVSKKIMPHFALFRFRGFVTSMIIFQHASQSWSTTASKEIGSSHHNLILSHLLKAWGNLAHFWWMVIVPSFKSGQFKLHGPQNIFNASVFFSAL